MTSKGKILVVDDDRLVLATVTHGLAQAGYEVTDADNGDDAILLARQHRHDLALLDIRMEGKSGFDVAAYLREYCRMPFMFLSAFTDEDTLRQVRELGAVAYLVKPLDIAQIVPAVESALNAVRSGGGLVDRPGSAVVAASPAPEVSAVSSETLGPHEADDSAVLLATGILMQRFSLRQAQARTLLHTVAQREQRGLSDQAQRLVQAAQTWAEFMVDHTAR